MTITAISPDTPEWNAWLKHYSGSKNELRMLSCLQACRPFYAISRFPPEQPRIGQLTRVDNVPQVSVRIIEGGRARPVVDIADRLEAKAERDALEHETTRDRRRIDRLRADAELAAVQAVMQNDEPRLTSHQQDIGVLHIVDPTERARVQETRKGAAPPRAKLVALRDDPVGQMHKRGHLNGSRGEVKEVADMRLRAARELQALYEIVEIGGARAMDPGKPAISGGKPSEPDLDRRRMAASRLMAVENDLGADGRAMIRLVLWQKMTLQRIALLQGKASQLEVKVLGHRFRECLDAAAHVLGYQQQGPNRVRRPRDVFDGLSDHAANPKLFNAIRRAQRSP